MIRHQGFGGQLQLHEVKGLWVLNAPLHWPTLLW